jgi:membrane protein implicated in regulation of membrane protease activity
MEPQHLSFALRGIKFLDNRVANPAYGLLLITGLTLVVVGTWGLKGWIVAALILFVLLIVLGRRWPDRRQWRDRARDRPRDGGQALPVV